MKNRFDSLAFVLILLSFLTFSFACSSKVEIEGIDFEAWKNDRGGCKGDRLAALDTFRPLKDELLGKDNQALMKTLGRPDQVELADRSQSFFIYFAEPGPECEQFVKQNEEPLKIILRLNALSRVSEVTITRTNPW
ncbi:hypothetical protein [Mongoliitalea daihaiensis]|uniref:hypothetical protein n=1 Tax=Mongoliitalea daihaiensis TaxID=2782006 RepID=UPI001F1E0429|nr:hypothetical protein [Mongoliitalea daihaiensis]UJP64248.1 hypothetical protein IPZ59_15750 [Mongoliitalea daihaiensis]